MLLMIGQRMLNEQIGASTAARERLAVLQGKRFAVMIRDTDLRIVMQAGADFVTLSASDDGDADVELTGGAFDLLRLARSAGLSDLRNVGATLNGDLKLAEAFADFLRLAMPEPEGLLADWIGDMPAHALGQAARGIGRWTLRAGNALEQNLAEYLQEETPTLVPAPLAGRFRDDVDRLRDDVDRAARRIDLLERRSADRAAR